MTIHEIEARCNMERASIRFYEREGLLTAPRRENGHRDYTEENVQTLLRIRLLRSLGISLEQIRALQSGETALSHTLRVRLAELSREQTQLAAAQSVCREIESAHVAFSELDAPKYLRELEQDAPSLSATCPEDDRTPYPCCPVRRFFARALDDLFCIVLSCALLCLLGVPLNAATRGLTALLWLLSGALMLFLEPALLHFFGTTPGKALFGLYIENDGGERLSYHEGLCRTWSVFWHGFGLGVPLLRLYRLYKRLDEALAGERAPWDTFLTLVQRDRRVWRIPASAVSAACAIFALVLLCAAQQLPPNRGALTPEQYVENVSYYADYLGISLGSTLQPDGTWRVPEATGNVIVIGSATHAALPPLDIQTEDGLVTGVSFTLEGENDEWVTYPDERIFLLSAALVGAQRGAGLFSGALSALSEALPDTLAPDSLSVDGFAEKNTRFSLCGVDIQLTLSARGYRIGTEICTPDETVSADARQLRLFFSASLS